MKKLFIAATGLFMAGAVMAINVNWTNTDGDGLWSNVANWDPSMPASVDIAYIGNRTLDPVIVNDTSATCSTVRMIDSSTLIVTNGGTLSFTLLLNYSTAGDAVVTIDGGTLTSGATENPSGTVRLGALADSSMELNVLNGGSLYTYQINASYNATGTGKINLFDGTIEVFKPSTSVLALDANGTMEIGAAGTFILAGDLTTTINNYITSGYLYGSGGKDLNVIYNDSANKTYVTVIPEPGTLGLFVLSGLGVMLARRVIRN